MTLLRSSWPVEASTTVTTRTDQTICSALATQQSGTTSTPALANYDGDSPVGSAPYNLFGGPSARLSECPSGYPLTRVAARVNAGAGQTGFVAYPSTPRLGSEETS